MTPAELEQLFQSCLTVTGPAYRQAREALVAEGAAARQWLQQRTAAGWQEQLLTSILLSWLNQPALYAQVGEIVTSNPGIDAPRGPITGRLSPTKKAEILRRFGPEIVPRLLEMAQKSGELADQHEKLVVFTALDYLQPESAVLPLIHLASESTDFQERELALGVLGTLGDERTYPVALAALTNRANAAPVRSAAAQALGQLGNPGATEAIRLALQDQTEPRAVRVQAARALGELGDPAASSALASVLRQEPESDLALSLTVVQALGQIGDSIALAALAEAAQNSRNSTLLAAVGQARNDAVA